MYSVAFIFEPGHYDETFYELDMKIAAFAESMSGFIGKEVWQSEDGKRVNSTYYWRDEDSITAFARHPKHIEAKKQYSKWYTGYQVVISKVERSYGDGKINHLMPANQRKPVKATGSLN